MLAYKYRFHTRGSIQYVYRHGRAGRSKLCTIRVFDNSRRTESRCVVVVTKKVAKSAPKRNRMRRRVYEIVRHLWPSIPPHTDIIISVHDSAVFDMPANQLRIHILELLQSMDIIVNK